MKDEEDTLIDDENSQCRGYSCRQATRVRHIYSVTFGSCPAGLRHSSTPAESTRLPAVAAAGVIRGALRRVAWGCPAAVVHRVSGFRHASVAGTDVHNLKAPHDILTQVRSTSASEQMNGDADLTTSLRLRRTSVLPEFAELRQQQYRRISVFIKRLKIVSSH
jgi:hypothetical protein